METVSAQEYQSVFSELHSLKEKFLALEQENHRLLGDLQQTALEKQQQHGELTLGVQQLEATIIAYQTYHRTFSIHVEKPENLENVHKMNST